MTATGRPGQVTTLRMRAPHVRWRGACQDRGRRWAGAGAVRRSRGRRPVARLVQTSRM